VQRAWACTINQCYFSADNVTRSRPRDDTTWSFLSLSLSPSIHFRFFPLSELCIDFADALSRHFLGIQQLKVITQSLRLVARPHWEIIIPITQGGGFGNEMRIIARPVTHLEGSVPRSYDWPNYSNRLLVIPRDARWSTCSTLVNTSRFRQLRISAQSVCDDVTRRVSLRAKMNRRLCERPSIFLQLASHLLDRYGRN